MARIVRAARAIRGTLYFRSSTGQGKRLSIRSMCAVIHLTMLHSAVIHSAMVHL